MAKFSLKSTLTSFLCFLLSGDKGSSFPGVWTLSPARSQSPALGSWTVTLSARIVQGARLQAQLGLRSFPNTLGDCSAGLALPTCTSHSLTRQVRVSAWSWKHLVNVTRTKLCGFSEAAALFCLSWPYFHQVSHVSPQSLLAKAAKLLKLFFSISVAWLHLWDFGNPSNQSILIGQWWQHHSDSKRSQWVYQGDLHAAPQKNVFLPGGCSEAVNENTAASLSWAQS